jgi:hypothetical protein
MDGCRLLQREWARSLSVPISNIVNVTVMALAASIHFIWPYLVRIFNHLTQRETTICIFIKITIPATSQRGLFT